MPSRILILSSAHPTDDKRVYHKFARSFVQAGWDVRWIGPDLRIPGSTLPREVQWSLISAPKGRVGRLLSLGLLLGVSRGHMGRGGWVYCPDPDAMLVAIPISRGIGANLLFDIHEMFHQTHISRWASGHAQRPAAESVRMGIRAFASKADLVVSPSPRVLDAYLPEDHKGLLLRNTVSRSFAEAVEASRKVSSNAGEPTVPLIMAGIPGEPRGTPELARALAILHAEYGLEMRALVIGDDEGLRMALDSSEPGLWSRTSRYFLVNAPLPHERMPELLSRCVAGIIGYTGSMAGPNLGNRTFEYMAAGIPILAPQESPLIAEIINMHRCGITYTNGDVFSLARALSAVAQDSASAQAMGDAGRAAFLASYSWDAEFERLLARMDEVDRAAAQRRRWRPGTG